MSFDRHRCQVPGRRSSRFFIHIAFFGGERLRRKIDDSDRIEGLPDNTAAAAAAPEERIIVGFFAVAAFVIANKDRFNVTEFNIVIVINFKLVVCCIMSVTLC